MNEIKRSQRKSTLFEKIHRISTNTLYQMNNWESIGFQTPELKKIDDTIFIFGQKFGACSDNKEALKDQNQKAIELFKNIIWITYRNQFPPINNEIMSDVGWGCMLRVGQMMFAEVLKRHKYYEIYEQNKIIKQNDLYIIVKEFLDLETQKFSIHRLCEIANKEFQIDVGKWFNPQNICHVLEFAHKLQTIEGCENLQFVIFSDSTIYQDQINQKFQIKGKCYCEILNEKTEILSRKSSLDFEIIELVNKQDQNISQINFHQNNTDQIDEYSLMKDEQTNLTCQTCQSTNNSILLSIICRIGLDCPNKKYLEQLLKLVEIKNFAGILGGKPGRALFFVGKQNDNFIFLDPHYVQIAVKKSELINKFQSYFCTNYKLFQAINIDSSLTINFYLRTPRDAQALFTQLIQLQISEKNDFFINIQENYPNIFQSHNNFDDFFKSIQNV